jgi:undecaprenyl-diphosphatase
LAGILALVIPALVGFSRVGLGVHYVSDVVAGWVFGLAWLAATVAAFRIWRRQKGEPAAPVEAGLDPAASTILKR